MSHFFNHSTSSLAETYSKNWFSKTSKEEEKIIQYWDFLKVPSSHKFYYTYKLTVGSLLSYFLNDLLCLRFQSYFFFGDSLSCDLKCIGIFWCNIEFFRASFNSMHRIWGSSELFRNKIFETSMHRTSIKNWNYNSKNAWRNHKSNNKLFIHLSRTQKPILIEKMIQKC